MKPSISSQPIAEVRVLKSLLADQRMTPDKKEDLVRNLMMKLEGLAASKEFDSCCAMIELWPIAGELYMHDVCDAIELWIDAKASTELTDYVRSIDDEHWGADDSALHWEEIISASMMRNQAQQAAAPNRSLTPVPKSEIPVRGSEG